uniref:Uncharacterized protein n=1 Tax=Solanum tuberosum TaxID=4113 RepID=M1DCS1_SOLTU
MGWIMSMFENVKEKEESDVQTILHKVHHFFHERNLGELCPISVSRRTDRQREVVRRKYEMSSKEASELVIQKNKGRIAELIGDFDIDHLKLQCMLDENIKQERDGQGRLANHRLVGKARLSSPTNPKWLNLTSV